MEKTYKTFYFFAILTFSITFIFLSLICYWLFYPVKTIVIENPREIKVDKEVYHPGDRINYSLDYCKYTNLQAEVSRSLVNSIRINFASYMTAIAPGCRDVTISDIIVPDFMDPGIYHLETVATYQVNPLRTESNSWRTVDFRIEK